MKRKEKIEHAKNGNRHMKKAWKEISQTGLNHDAQRIGKFFFVQDWPAELLPVLVALAESEAWLVPAWCHEVVLTWLPNLKSCADAETQYDYRRLRVRIGPSFFDQAENIRRSMFRHELMHASTNVPMMHAETVIEELLPDDENKTFRKRVLADLRERHESCVVDLLQCIENKLANKS